MAIQELELQKFSCMIYVIQAATNAVARDQMSWELKLKIRDTSPRRMNECDMVNEEQGARFLICPAILALI